MEIPHARQHPRSHEHRPSLSTSFANSSSMPHCQYTRTSAVGQVVARSLVEEAERMLTWGTAHTGLLCYTRQW